MSARMKATVAALLCVSITQASLSDNFYSGCNLSKGCSGMPEDCVSSKTCDVAISYVGISGQAYRMEIFGPLLGGDFSTYLGVGLSIDDKMRDDSLMACSMPEGSEGLVEMYWAWKNAPRPVTADRLEAPTLGLDNVQIEMEDAHLLCTFDRKTSLSIPHPGKDEEILVDMNAARYHFLFARGFIDLKNDNVIKKHESEDRAASGKSFMLTDFDSDLPLADRFYQGCGTTKGCVGAVPECVQGKNCPVAISYVGLSEDQYNIEIFGGLLGSDPLTYMAVGLSTDTSMTDDSIMACSIPTLQDGRMEMYLSWRDKPKPKTATRLDNSTLGIKDINIQRKDDQLLCTFKRDNRIDIPSFSDENQSLTFDLNLKSYNLLFARGLVDPEKDFIIKKHGDEEKYATEGQYNLGAFNPFGGSNKFYLDCGKTKGCVGYPKGCLESQDCQMAASYQGLSEDEYLLEMQDSSPMGYMALAISQDELMGNDSVIVCLGNLGRIEHNWNFVHDSQVLDPPQLGLSDPQVAIEDSLLHCAVTIKAKTTLSAPGESNLMATFDLNEEDYFVHLAKGPYEKESIQTHKSKYATPEERSFSEFNHFYGASEDYNGCFENGKGCFGIPSGCEESQSCSVLFTYRRISEEEFAMSISGNVNSDTIYLGAAISTTDKMGDNNAMICYALDGQVDVANSWNTKNPYGNNLLENPHLGLTNISGSVDNGRLRCRFNRRAKLDFAIPGQSDLVSFDLDSTAYYLLLAKGPFFKTVKAGGIALDGHSLKGKSGQPVDLNDAGEVRGSSNLMIKLHGAFMVFAWIFLASTGTFTSRYCKKEFNGRKLFGKDLWFPIHQCLMIGTWFLGIVGFLLIVVEYGLDPLALDQIQNNPHALLGMICLCLMFIQPFMALLRCSPDHKLRIVFNLVHACVGWSAVVLALVAIFLTTLPSFTKIALKEGSQIISIVSMAFFVIFHVIMTVRMLVAKEGQCIVPGQAHFITFLAGSLVIAVTFIVFIILT